LSRRPAIKIAPALFLGVSCGGILPLEIRAIDLLLATLVLLFFTLVLKNRLFPLVQDILLFLILYMTGMAACILDEMGMPRDRCLQQWRTHCGHGGDRLRPTRSGGDRIRAEGVAALCQLYRRACPV